MAWNIVQLVEYLPTIHKNLRFPPYYHRQDVALMQFWNPEGEGKEVTVIFYYIVSLRPTRIIRDFVSKNYKYFPNY